jgi:hypothetical protein
MTLPGLGCTIGFQCAVVGDDIRLIGEKSKNGGRREARLLSPKCQKRIFLPKIAPMMTPASSDFALAADQ